MSTDRRTPLARARGLGSAHAGVGHWWRQRLTAAALVPLGLWLAFALRGLATAGCLGLLAVGGYAVLHVAFGR